MTRKPKGWIARLSDVIAGLSREDCGRLRDRLQDSPTDRRAALALRIALLRQDLNRKPSPAALAPETAPSIEIPAPTIAAEDTPTESVAEPEAPVPARPRKKKANFAAVSLDDAASLLSAFGGSDVPPTGNAQDTPRDQTVICTEHLQDVDIFVPDPQQKPPNG